MLKIKHANQILLLLAATLAGLGYGLYGAPKTLEDPFTWSSVFGSFLLFWFWVMGVLHWGQAWSKWLDWPSHNLASIWTGRLALGSVWASLSIYLINLIFVMGTGLKWIVPVWVFAGIIIAQLLVPNSTPARAAPPSPALPSTKTERALAHTLLGIIAIAALAKIIEGFMLRPHGDPFVCYLPAPRAWFDRGSLLAFRDSTLYPYASSWESLYQWGNLLLAGAPGTALDSGQRFGQWCSGFFGHFGITLAAFALFQPDPTKRGQIIGAVAALAAFSVPAIRTHANLAKNNVGAAFWMFAALIPLFFGNSLKATFAAGLLCGAGAIAKMSYALFGIGQIAAWTLWKTLWKTLWRTIQDRKSALRFFTVLILGGVAGISWIALRNIYITGNPVFPFFNQYFSNDWIGLELTQSIANAVAPRGAWTMTLNRLWSFALEFATHWWLMPIALLALFYGSLPLRYMALGGWLSAVTYTLTFRLTSQLRYQGPTLILLGALGGCALMTFILESKNKRLSTAVAGLMSLSIVSTSGITFFTFLQLSERRYQPSSAAVLGHTAGSAKKWIRDNTSLEKRAFSVGDDEIYYAAHVGLTDYLFDGQMNRALTVATTPLEQARTLLAHKRRFLYLRTPNLPRFQEMRIGGLLRPLHASTACRVYTDNESEIYDLACAAEKFLK